MNNYQIMMKKNQELIQKGSLERNHLYYKLQNRIIKQWLEDKTATKDKQNKQIMSVCSLKRIRVNLKITMTAKEQERKKNLTK